MRLHFGNTPELSRYSVRLALVFILLFITLFPLPLSSFQNSIPMARASSPDVVISQVYGGGGNSGAPLRNDFIELFNRGNSPVSLNGWSVQYASATGDLGTATPLTNFTLQVGQYYLVQEGSGGAIGNLLPNSDATGGIAMSATGGKIALVNSVNALSCGGATVTCSAGQLASIVDLVGYGTTSGTLPREGTSSAPSPSNTIAVLRTNVCSDTDQNGTDFSTGTPNPRNTSQTLAPCGTPGNQPIIPVCGGSLSTPQGTAATRNVSASDADGIVTSLSVTSLVPTPTAGLISITSVTPAATTGGALSATLSVSNTVSAGNYTVTLTFTNNDVIPQTSTCNISVSVTSNLGYTPIFTIQAASRQSPFAGQSVTTEGVVTGLKSNGFFMQDPTGDGSDATSDGIFVFTSTAPGVTLGNRVRVSGTIQEYSGSADAQPLTEFAAGATITDLGAGATITPIIISTDPARTGPNIRRPPAVIYSSATYDPSVNGLDFYESLEGMLVQVDNALVVGSSDQYGVFVVVPDSGVGATGLTNRKAIAITATDFNPERILIDDGIVGSGNNPIASVGDRITAAIVGPLDYTTSNFNVNFKLQTRSVISAIDNSQRATPETTSAVNSATQLRVASYNLENYTASDAAKVAKIAGHIKNNLASPDLITLIEVQDDSGPTSDGTTISDQNLTALVNAITGLGGPTYQFRYVTPENNTDGGQVGGNIRQVFFFRTDRGLSFVAKGSAGFNDANAVNPDGSLTLSPGRIAPTNVAFSSSRKPLAGEFSFNGQRLIVIANHLNSKIGDGPLYGSPQPPVLGSEAKRRDQATQIRNFVTNILTNDASAAVIVAGDLNDYEFSRPLNILKNNEGALPANQTLTNLAENASVANERYTINYQGNAQAIDHILYSPALVTRLVNVDIVHLNSDLDKNNTLRASDHDAVAAIFDFSNTICATPFVVTSATDDGAGTTCGTLSRAIVSGTAAQPIVFQAGLTEIKPAAPMPPLPAGVTISATCTPDGRGRGVPSVSLNAVNISGPQTNAMLRLTGSNSVAGLSIINYVNYAVDISGSGNTLTCSYLGIAADGTTKQANGGGVRFSGSVSNTSIGLAGNSTSGNVISGNNNYAVLDSATGGTTNRFYFTYIGYDKNGVLPLRNTKGVKFGGNARFIFGPGNRVII